MPGCLHESREDQLGPSILPLAHEAFKFCNAGLLRLPAVKELRAAATPALKVGLPQGSDHVVNRPAILGC